jgi:S-adenosylhomocysteine hydrolase
VVPEPEILAETGSSSTSVLAATGSGSTGVLAGAMTVLIGFGAVAVGMARRLRRRSH